MRKAWLKQCQGEAAVKKNDEFILKIEDMSVGGEGIGRMDGMTFFVKDALIGDLVRVGITKLKKTYGYARLIEIVEPSPDRVEPVCVYSRQCGGCQLQALSYEKQLEFKQRLVENDLIRIGGFAEVPMEPIIGMDDPFHYRNKAQFPIGTDRDGHIVTGFFAGRSHRIIPNRDCALGVPVNRQILDIVIEFMERCGIPAYDETTGEGLVRHVLIRYGFATEEILVCLIINGGELPCEEELIRPLAALEGMTGICINSNTTRSNVILGEKTRVLWGQGYLTDEIGQIRFRISPESFYQVNPVQTEVIYRLAAEYAALTGTQIVWDLYCGIGTISLTLAGQAGWVYGVEVVPQAVEDARRSASLNGITTVEFFVGKAEEVFPKICGREAAAKGEGTYKRSDVVIVDPPRKGCDPDLLGTILAMAPERIVYISCDPATLARDAKILCEGGYRLARVRPVDNFCQTVHVETVCLLSRCPA